MRRIDHDAADFYSISILPHSFPITKTLSRTLTYSIIHHHLGLATSIPEVGQSLDNHSATAVYIAYPKRDPLSNHIRIRCLLCAIYVHTIRISRYRRPACYYYFYKTSYLAWPDGLTIHTLHSCSRLCNPLPWAHHETSRSAHSPMPSLQ